MSKNENLIRFDTLAAMVQKCGLPPAEMTEACASQPGWRCWHWPTKVPTV
jgi:hypothetical protein